MTRISLRTSVILAVVALLAAACGDSDSDSNTSTDTSAVETTAAPTASAAPTTAAATTAAPTSAAPTTAAPTTAAPTTAAPVVGEIRASFVGAATQPYAGVAVADEEIRVYFNNGASGFIVAVYHGPGTADPTGLCPGNSVLTSEFEHVSNAPLTDGACDDFPTELGSVRVCDANVWIYQTKIPNDISGTLFGSVEAWVDGAITGQTGQAANTAGTPVIDYDADSFDVDAMFTSDGRTKIDCAPPLT